MKHVVITAVSQTCISRSPLYNSQLTDCVPERTSLLKAYCIVSQLYSSQRSLSQYNCIVIEYE